MFVCDIFSEISFCLHDWIPYDIEDLLTQITFWEKYSTYCSIIVTPSCPQHCYNQSCLKSESLSLINFDGTHVKPSIVEILFNQCPNLRKFTTAYIVPTTSDEEDWVHRWLWMMSNRFFRLKHYNFFVMNPILFILYMYIWYMDMFTCNICYLIAYTLYSKNFWWWLGFTIRYYALLYRTFICVCNERIKNNLYD